MNCIKPSYISETAKEELIRVDTSEKDDQEKISLLRQKLYESKLPDFKTAKAVEAISFKPGITPKLFSIHDAFANYSLNEGQAELVIRLTQFLGSKTESVFLLKGYAGTGKTFITKGLTEYFKTIGRNYVLAAPTGKASKAIARQTISDVSTIHKIIYSFNDLDKYLDEISDSTGAFKFYAQLAINSASDDTIYLVDEASMIADVYQEAEFFRFGSGHFLTDFLKFVNLDLNDHTKKVIFIGDDAKLPPAGMSFSPALNAEYLLQQHLISSSGFELSEVLGQKSENGVVVNAPHLGSSLKTKVSKLLSMNFS